MVKTKNKRNLSEKLIKKSGKSKVINPFEIHINKSKFDVLGRKSKNDRGIPGIARSKSIKKRKETLLQEFKIKDKVNRFFDKRIGENNSSMTQEDRIMARYTAERIRAHKKTMFNLAEDEILTHKGKTLSEIEKYDNPGSDDEEDGIFDKSGGLDADVVEAHFGGGMFREKEDGAKTHATLIEELIAESKKRKVEKLQTKEQTLKLTEKLDADWHELIPLLGVGKTTEDVHLHTFKPELGSYDQLTKELKFESRGMPSDRLKSEDELAKEEKEKLEKLEEERLRRMKGLEDSSESKGLKHRSADDLDDGFEIDSEFENSDNDSEDDDNKDESSADEDEESDKQDSDNDENEDEILDKDGEDIESDNAINEVIEKKSSEDCEDISLKEDVSESEDEDNLSDLKEDSDDENYDDNKNSVMKKDVDEKSNEKKTEDFLKLLKIKKELMEKARNELPYTFDFPENYEKFETLLEKHSVDHQSVIIERMIKCYHPSLGENNIRKLEQLFAFILQLLNNADDNVVWKLLDRLAPHLYDLTQFSRGNSSCCILNVLTEKHDDFKKQPHRYPETDTIVFLKLIPLLFPTSDIRHQVTTPAIVFLIQILNQCRTQGRRAISCGLFIVTLLLEYTELSKKYVPETVHFLQGMLEMTMNDCKLSLPYNKPGYHPLVLESSQENFSKDNSFLSFADLSESEVRIDDEFRVKAFNTAMQLLNNLCDYLEYLPSFKTIFSPIYKLLKKIELSKYPSYSKDQVNKLIAKLDELFQTKKLESLVLEKKRPKALRLYEPKIEKVIDGKKRYDISEEKAEHEKLVAKYKKEMKGALREIRRDKDFLNKVKLRTQAKSDEERKRKVKQIYGWGAAQEGEFNKLKKRKKH